MSLTASSVQDLTEYVRDLLAADADLAAAVTTFTTREFPYCDAFPAVHVNATRAADDTSIGGMGRRIRTVQLRIYVTLNRADSIERENDLWARVDHIRTLIDGDRQFGNRLTVPVIRLPVDSVPSPTGSYYVGTRVITADCELAETL